MQPRLIVCVLIAGLVSPSCSPRKETAPPRPWHTFVEDLLDVDRIARLDTGTTRLITSYDRSGGNDDFNSFEGKGSEYGWVTIATLKGPGCLRRFWTTGVDFGHPFKLYFDGEKVPRISGKVEDIFGRLAPFTPPLARYLNYCWASYVPLTFNKSLRIETLAPPIHPFWGARRLFYQLNVEDFPSGQPVETFPATLTEADKEAIAKVNETWRKSVAWPEPRHQESAPVSIAPGQTGVLFVADGPAVIRDWSVRVTPEQPESWSAVESGNLVQDAVLRVTYDQATQPSIETPLGDFFCNAWRSRCFGSLLQGRGTNAYVSRLPLPFKGRIRVDVINGSDRSISAAFDGVLGKDWSPAFGYLHAAWRRSGSAPGTPHVFADWIGPGKLVGTFLGVTGLGNDWWVLEGDETMNVDGEVRPSWHGTGLEDYFNGGWYYRGAAFNALNGIMDRAPFRVAQYRFHPVDPVAFSNSLHMAIERGDQNVSAGYFRSVSFAYLNHADSVPGCADDRAARRDIDHPYYRQTFMLQLGELERMNNFAEARDAINEYVERFPDAEESGVLKLRALEYRRLAGEILADSEYEPFSRGDFGPVAADQAKLLLWFHQDPRRALVGMNANGKAQAFLDGQAILSGDHPFNLFVTGVELGDGPHALAASVEMTRTEPWLQMAVRTHGGVVGSGPPTLFSRTPTANWNRTDGNVSAWQQVGLANNLRGTPDAPMIGGIPNAFVLLSSKAYSVRSHDWGYYKGMSYFRVDFTQPLQGWPASTAFDMTGLDH